MSDGTQVFFMDLFQMISGKVIALMSLLGRYAASVPGAGTITPHDAGIVSGLFSAPSQHICPKALSRAVDHAWDV